MNKLTAIMIDSREPDWVKKLDFGVPALVDTLETGDIHALTSDGPAGSGKTYTALRFAHTLAKGGKIEEQVKAAVIETGQTVKAGALMAMYMKGRVSWDNKKLEGMMALIPDLAKARSEGKPTVQIRTVK
ncbi:MAG: hypothetical protein WHV44_03635 [Anaerolineales bacterium]